VCGSTCAAGTIDCGDGKCRDLSTDNAKCGATCAAAVACGAGKICTAGVCLANCGGTTTQCGTACVDLRYDPSNCGGCGVSCGAGKACSASTCVNLFSAVEDFDRAGWMWSPWAMTTSSGTVSAACKHDGIQGIADPDWIYRTDFTIGLPGDKLSVWAQAGTGRVYLGFGATAAGGWSLVMGPNTSQFMWQQNPGWGYTELASVPFTFTAGKWYRMEIVFGSAAAVTGRLYDSDGVTVLATNATTLTGLTTGGVTLRSFGGSCIDTLTR
jgi:hypothetical protein